MSQPTVDPRDAAQVTAQVAALTQADLPLVPGLRAAAQEASSRRLATALTRVADGLEKGKSLDEALAGSGRTLRGHWSTVLSASQRSGHLREALLDLVEHDQALREAVRTAYSSIFYPAALLGLGMACFAFLHYFVIIDFVAMLQEFELNLPRSTSILVQLTDAGVWLYVIPLCIVAGLMLSRLVLPRARWQRFVATVPIFGPMLHWCGVAQGTRAIAHLITQQIPLPEALRLGSQGLHDANVAEVWRLLAEEVERGTSLSAALLATHRVPASLAPLAYWGEQTHQLPAALLTASEMLEGRVRLRARLIRTVFPPVVFLVIAGAALFTVVALIAPLFGLIFNLSG